MFRTQNHYQNNEKWKNTKLGDSSETIGEWGGLLTSIAMMLNGIGYKEQTPETVNEEMKKAGGFLKALLIPSLLPYVWPNCIYRGMQPCENSNAPIEEIDAAVKAGKPVILEVDSKEQTGTQTHFVLVKDKKGDDYVVYDPHQYDGDGPAKEVLLTARYKHNSSKLESAIHAVLWFDFHTAALPKAPKPTSVKLPADPYTLYVAEEGLVLRASPLADSYPLKCLLRGTELICLEPKGTAEAKLGVNGKWIRVQDPNGDQGYVAAWFVNSINFPVLMLPAGNALPSRKKWCLKNVAVESPRFETWEFEEDKVGMILRYHEPDKSFKTLLKNTVLHVLRPNQSMPGDVESSSWSGIVYQKTYYVSSVKNWVTTRVTGWINDADLDDYREDEREEFRNFVVTIPRQTQSSTDAQQYFYVDKEKSKARYNMCGELSIAFIAGKKIDTVLDEWKNHSKASEALYNSMVGKADKPLEPRHMEDLLNLHVGELGIDYNRYKMDKDGKPAKDYVHLAASNEEQPRADQRVASKDLEGRLRECYFITNLKIDTNTGDLEDAYSAGERNHWVVVDKITRNGSRVELYNPFPNRREEYSFGEFYRSIGGDPNSGWWIKRDNPKFAAQKKAAVERSLHAPKFEAEIDERSERAEQEPPMFEVAIDNRTENPDDAEQYLTIRGEGSKPKTKLCGEFSVAFILGQSLDISLKRWMDKQGKEAGLWELVTLLQAYGFNRRKYKPLENSDKPDQRIYYAAPKDKQGMSSDPENFFKSFSIDTVLEYWKGVQPNLYANTLGGDRNEPTGPEDLITILEAYGYDRGRQDFLYYRPGSQESFGYAPGRDAEALTTHFLIAGVNIHGTTGRLRPTGVAHWVVVTKITPRGNLVGGNGGWVELYNPFPNCWEEYSYREFMTSFTGSSAGSTLWVKRDVSPVFTWQAPSPARSKENEKDLEKNEKGKGQNDRKSDLKAEKDRKRDEDKRKKDSKLEKVDGRPALDVDKLVRERLGVDSIPREISRWIRDASDGDRFFAEELTDALCESGILLIQEEVINNKKIRTNVLTDPEFSDGVEAAIRRSIDILASSPLDPAFKVASLVAPRFTATAIQEIREIQKTMPVQANKKLSEFRAWTRGLASKLKDPLEIKIKKQIESLIDPQSDESKAFGSISTIVPRFNSGTIEEDLKNLHSDPETLKKVRKIWGLERQEEITLREFSEWVRGIISEPRSNVFRIKRWGDPGMSDLGFDVSTLNDKEISSSNFQAVGLYNKATGFGAVSNFLIIPPNDVLKLEALQVEDEFEDKREDWLRQKMSWLCKRKGTIYFVGEDDSGGDLTWRTPNGIHWGTVALGGNLVQVVGDPVDFKVKLPSEDESTGSVKMVRLAGFTKEDWSKPVDVLLASGLVHRCYCVYEGNDFGDSPKGIVYSPFWSPAPGNWEFRPKPQKGRLPTELWIPVVYLENFPE
jgi:hypothetical protein